tara:strand:+ start:278 stop:511 length:234 start_codon:yes stop_codon:yes gene_type:complete
MRTRLLIERVSSFKNSKEEEEIADHEVLSDVFLHEFEKFLIRKLGKNWSYKFRGESDNGMHISLTIWWEKYNESKTI